MQSCSPLPPPDIFCSPLLSSAPTLTGRLSDPHDHHHPIPIILPLLPTKDLLRIFTQANNWWCLASHQNSHQSSKCPDGSNQNLQLSTFQNSSGLFALLFLVIISYRMATAASIRSTLLSQIPTPLTGRIMILVPCLNSLHEFILLSGSRLAILTPSFAFLLWADLKN